jgi:cation diffusion facilitator CzcD-associated flavoprotein CzcO
MWKAVKNNRNDKPLQSAIIGGGPAGLAVLCAAESSGRLQQLLQNGLVLVERDEDFGPGNLSAFAIDSDSKGRSFIQFSLDSDKWERLKKSPEWMEMKRNENLPIRLTESSTYLRRLGLEVMTKISEAGYEQTIQLNTCAHHAQRGDDEWILATSKNGLNSVRRSANLILATGASPRVRIHNQ